MINIFNDLKYLLAFTIKIVDWIFHTFNKLIYDKKNTYDLFQKRISNKVSIYKWIGQNIKNTYTLDKFITKSIF